MLRGKKRNEEEKLNREIRIGLKSYIEYVCMYIAEIIIIVGEDNTQNSQISSFFLSFFMFFSFDLYLCVSERNYCILFITPTSLCCCYCCCLFGLSHKNLIACCGASSSSSCFEFSLRVLRVKSCRQCSLIEYHKINKNNNSRSTPTVYLVCFWYFLLCDFFSILRFRDKA